MTTESKSAHAAAAEEKKAMADAARAERKAEKAAAAAGPDVFALVVELAAALRSRDWRTALRVYRELVDFLDGDLDNVPAVSSLFPAGLAFTPMPDSADSLASALEAFAATHSHKKAAFAFGPGPHDAAVPRAAFPWAELVPLILQALQVILNRR